MSNIHFFQGKFYISLKHAWPIMWNLPGAANLRSILPELKGLLKASLWRQEPLLLLLSKQPFCSEKCFCSDGTVITWQRLMSCEWPFTTFSNVVLQEHSLDKIEHGKNLAFEQWTQPWEINACVSPVLSYLIAHHFLRATAPTSPVTNYSEAIW